MGRKDTLQGLSTGPGASTSCCCKAAAQPSWLKATTSSRGVGPGTTRPWPLVGGLSSSPWPLLGLPHHRASRVRGGCCDLMTWSENPQPSLLHVLFIRSRIPSAAHSGGDWAVSSEGRGRRMGTALRRALLLPDLAVLPGGSRPWGGRACFRGASCARLRWTATVAGEAEPVGLRGPFTDGQLEAGEVAPAGSRPPSSPPSRPGLQACAHQRLPAGLGSWGLGSAWDQTGPREKRSPAGTLQTPASGV